MTAVLAGIFGVAHEATQAYSSTHVHETLGGVSSTVQHHRHQSLWLTPIYAPGLGEFEVNRSGEVRARPGHIFGALFVDNKLGLLKNLTTGAYYPGATGSLIPPDGNVLKTKSSFSDWVITTLASVWGLVMVSIPIIGPAFFLGNLIFWKFRRQRIAFNGHKGKSPIVLFLVALLTALGIYLINSSFQSVAYEHRLLKGVLINLISCCLFIYNWCVLEKRYTRNIIKYADEQFAMLAAQIQR